MSITNEILTKTVRSLQNHAAKKHIQSAVFLRITTRQAEKKSAPKFITLAHPLPVAACLIVKGTIAPRFEAFFAKCHSVVSVHVVSVESLRAKVGAKRAELLKPYDFFVCDNVEYESTERLVSNLLKTRQLVQTKLRGEKGCRNVIEALAHTAVKQHGQTWTLTVGDVAMPAEQTCENVVAALDAVVGRWVTGKLSGVKTIELYLTEENGIPLPLFAAPEQAGKKRSREQAAELARAPLFAPDVKKVKGETVDVESLFGKDVPAELKPRESRRFPPVPMRKRKVRKAKGQVKEMLAEYLAGDTNQL